MKPKPFQLATIDAAIKALGHGSRRFLLADEVGLGKTVVAKEIIWKLASVKRDGAPFRVFYVCSNQTLSAQNAPRLILDKRRDHYELLDVSRPSLLANGHYPASSTAHVQLFRFSPDTALPFVKRKARSGVMAERALLFVLRARVLKWRLPPGRDLRTVFKGQRVKEKNFAKAVRFAANRYRNRTLLRGHNFCATFLAATRAVFELAPGANLQDKLNDVATNEPQELLGKLRVALTMASLECLPPDLVIFDEFHRYQDKVFKLPTETSRGTRKNTGGGKGGDPEEIHRTFLELLPAESRPRLLLLSATPFKFSQVPSGRSASSRSDAVLFHRLVGFLHGDGAIGLDTYQDCSKAFQVFAAELAAGRFTSPILQSAKTKLEDRLLRPRMARMERAAFSSMAAFGAEPEAPHEDSSGEFPQDRDIALLAGFARGLRERDRKSAVAFWRSIPLPHQTMGSHYAMWAKAPKEGKKRWRKLPGVSAKDRDGMRLRGEAHHPKIRELLRQFPPERLALPWLAPSAPWWPLQGPWAKEEPLGNSRKGLLFSHYRAAPAAVAGLVSLAVEEWAARRMGWSNSSKLAKRSFLPPRSLSNIILFHPSAWLAENVDPAHKCHNDRKRAITAISKELKAKLPASIRHAPEKQSDRPLWKVLSLIEQHCPTVPSLLDVWKKIRDGRKKNDHLVKGLNRIAEEGSKAERYVSTKELRAIAWFALTAPGVVLLRRIAHSSKDKNLMGNPIRLAEIASLCWKGLHSYFDQPWFVARLSPNKRVRYPAALQSAIYDGNFEACLDEHFWLDDPDNQNWFREPRRAGRLETLTRSLSIRAAPVALQPLNAADGRRVTLAAHAALPLSNSATNIATEIGEEKLRADELRHAFNTPFWPHLLCTTSVGQEGLDFHKWCQTVIHWDLPSGPIELEQREGRVDRFRSLAVRRAVACLAARRGDAGTNQAGKWILWDGLEKFADGLSDVTGLQPWWVMPGASIQRLYLDAPSSDERARKHELAQQRDLYRLVLGMPSQWQLLARLTAYGLDPETARRTCLNLSAWREYAPASAVPGQRRRTA